MMPLKRRHRETLSSERRLKWMVLLFLVCVAAPLYILFDRVYSQLRQEALYQYRLGAERAVSLVDDEITRLMTREANRPFADYGFFRVEEQTLLQTKNLALSPLSQFPISPHVPGLIGYFQMSPDDAFSSPVLPDITQAQFEAYHIQFSEAEYAKRLALKNRLEQILNTDQLSIRTTPPKRQSGRAQLGQYPSETTAAPLSSPPAAPSIAKAYEQEREEAALDSADSSVSSGVDLRSTFRGTKLTELNIDKIGGREDGTD